MTLAFHNYQVNPIDNNRASPNLRDLADYASKRWGADNLGIFGKRTVRAGAALSTHWSGAAIDLSWRDAGRSVAVNDMLPLFTNFPERTGIQAVHDYVGGRIWRIGRTPGWRSQTLNASTGMGQAWAQWFHIEVHPSFFDNVVPFEEKIMGSPPPETGWPPFNPAAGQFSLWPFNTSKPTIQVGARGDAVRYAQGVLRFRLNHAIGVDGEFGNITRDHVSWFQTTQGLKADGIIGPITWGRLDTFARS